MCLLERQPFAIEADYTFLIAMLHISGVIRPVFSRFSEPFSWKCLNFPYEACERGRNQLLYCSIFGQQVFCLTMMLGLAVFLVYW